jgi:Putative beta-barrel porin-2, OmpL-like. bbp2
LLNKNTLIHKLKAKDRAFKQKKPQVDLGTRFAEGSPRIGFSRVRLATKTTYNQMKSRLQMASLGAALLTASAVQAEVKINENLSLDGYAIGSGVVTEGTADTNGKFIESGRVYDSVKIAANGKYGDFSGKISLYVVNENENALSQDAGILDAYVTYKVGNLSLTGGKFLGWLGYESFDSPNNAFISFSQVFYSSPYSTGVKADYAGDGFSAGVSVRDSQNGPGGEFFEGDGDITDEVGYEAYVLFTGVKGLTAFAGIGFEKVEDNLFLYNLLTDENDIDSGRSISNVLTTDFWASYMLTEKLSVTGEFATTEDVTNSSWLLQSGYAISDDLSVAGRLTYFDGKAGDTVAYGVASTYTITSNFSIKGEVTKNDSNSGGTDPFSYALQGLFRF